MKLQNTEQNLPSQGERTSRDRHEGDIVPAPLASSSNDGHDCLLPHGGQSQLRHGKTQPQSNEEERGERDGPRITSVEEVKGDDRVSIAGAFVFEAKGGGKR